MIENQETHSRKFKGVWVPKEIWESNELSWFEKCLWAEINSLEDEESGCTASNKYLCKMMGCRERVLQLGLANLKAKKIIWVDSFDHKIRTLRTSVKAQKTSHEKFDTTPINGCKILHPRVKDLTPIPLGQTYSISLDTRIDNTSAEIGLSAGADDLCNFFLKKMKEKKPNFLGTIKPSWKKAAKRLLKHRTPEEIRKSLDWVFDHSFWSSVIHCPESLWKNLDRIETQMAQGTHENLDENKTFVKDISHPDIDILGDHIGFKFGPMKYICVKYSEKNFRQKVLEQLEKLGVYL